VAQPTIKRELMNRKINMFTLIIFAYSIVICVTFKKGQTLEHFSTAKVESKSSNLHKSSNLKPEDITASAAPIVNNNQ
jgi:hypothetical protein